MITVNTPFEDLGPLETYAWALREVTERPTDVAIAALTVADTTLTNRAVLYPHREFVSGVGYRTFGFRPRTISAGVQGLARLALHKPGSLGYYAVYEEVFDVSPEEARKVDPHFANEELRRREARAALILLGSKLAVSGALVRPDIRPAYEIISAFLDNLGKHDNTIAHLGLGAISRGLLDERRALRRATGANYQNPIGNKEARGNIRAAWGVVGRPRGPYARLAARGWGLDLP